MVENYVRGLIRNLANERFEYLHTRTKERLMALQKATNQTK